jgi:hypothetical protein
LNDKRGKKKLMGKKRENVEIGYISNLKKD